MCAEDNDQAINRRGPQVFIPRDAAGDADIYTYRLGVRVQWAKAATAYVPLPKTALGARWRIPSPSGQPFPLNVPRWANYWHRPIGESRRDSKGSKEG